MGIARSKAAIEKADIVIHLFDVTEYLSTPATLLHLIEDQIKLWTQSNTPYLLAANKADMVHKDHATHFFENAGLKVALLSAKQNENISTIKDQLFHVAADGLLHHEGTIITNARHFGALNDVLTSLHDVQAGLENRLSGDLISLDLRRCLHFLGEITGEVIKRFA